VTRFDLPERGIRGNSHALLADNNSDENATLCGVLQTKSDSDYIRDFVVIAAMGRPAVENGQEDCGARIAERTTCFPYIPQLDSGIS
jgi:hypothetical protein